MSIPHTHFSKSHKTEQIESETQQLPFIFVREPLKRTFIDLTEDENGHYKSTSREISQSVDNEQPQRKQMKEEEVNDIKNAAIDKASHSSHKIPLSNASHRRKINRRLQRLKGPSITIVNEIDESSPSLFFHFVDESILGKNVQRADEGFMSGCNCRSENGRNCGCEYRSCECLQLSDKDENGEVHFPYSASQRNKGCLRKEYLETRNHIYECNPKCNCRDNCKNKLVQHGRKVPLEIFKTLNRGWGLRCPQALQKGQFVDTYRGEIITNEEAEARAHSRTIDQDNYLMDLDKFDGKEEDNDDQASYVCDGMNVGGPTRFINHSCDPNCKIFTVSYNHADTRIYEIAFFASEEISAGTELTFEYKDENDRDIITDEAADEKERENGYRPARCLCGSANCRGYFFT